MRVSRVDKELTRTKKRNLLTYIYMDMYIFLPYIEMISLATMNFVGGSETPILDG